MASRSEAGKFYRALQREGFIVSQTRGNHMRITHPHMVHPVFAAQTPSDWRALHNVRAMLKRYMVAANDNVL